MTPHGWPEPVPPRLITLRIAVLLGSGCLALLVLWAAFTEVEIVVSAPAAARPARAVAELRAPDARAVGVVRAQEGDAVRRGQTLIELDARLLEARARSAHRALAARRRALADARAVVRVLEGGLPAHEAGTLPARLEVVEHRSRLAQLDDEIAALDSERAAARERRRSARELLAIRRERFAAARAAAARGALSRFELLAARQDLLAQQAELDDAAGRLQVLGERLAGRRSARRGAAAAQRQSALEAVTGLEVEVAELETALATVADERRRGRLRAPVDGVLDRLLVATGDFVQRGEVVAVVVPAAAPLTFEARIPPSQVAFLHPGQACRIKLDALPFARYGALDCVLERLGGDVVEDEGAPAHYLARVRPAARRLEADGQLVRLEPGATGWVDIIAGRRTVLGFVTEPLTRFRRESLRER